ncbi:wings apart-like protein homolog [Microcaecilia unicolor]|uniref:Wings apart-like protein homolog n=1 Tax=Microcaecilia unicolor TaxID=1415580 RepID=A0A6P7YDF8_9AMPH|nr:wings apart-like protein homolog [Microcaecilia unicolor]
MTSRFGKTYSRKGGNGNSKFDEVFSNKRTTLSTKWGETTFMAKLGQKRPNFKPEVSEIPKKIKVDEDLAEDPFGFDSDDESLPVSSRSLVPTKGTSQQCMELLETADSENFTAILEANSRDSQSVSGDNIVSSKFISFDSALHGLKEKSTNNIVEDRDEKNSSAASPAECKQILAISDDNENNYSPYQNAEDGKEKSVNTEATAVSHNIEAKDVDAWDSQIGNLDFSAEITRTKEPLKTDIFDWDEHLHEHIRIQESIADFDDEQLSVCKNEEGSFTDKDEMENLQECINEEIPQTVLKLSNCRTYCRSNKTKQGLSPFDKLLDDTSHSVAKSNNVSDKGDLHQGSKTFLNSGTRPAGRTRDYTVLHPSCLSVCNVTIQDTLDRSMEEFTTASSTDLGEAGRLRKKADLAATKTTTRFRPSNTKSKKDAKLEFFGFDEVGDEGGSKSSGRSNYKIKYFGFDDLSESEDEDDDDWHLTEQNVKNKSRSSAVSSILLQSSTDVSEHSQDLQSGTNLDFLDYSEDSYNFPEVLKKSVNKHGEKSKENTRKIFSGPKRQVRPPSNDVSRPKDDGVFKAPAPPPKVIKTVTIPTQPYQDIVTALKCRKEHKELYTVVQHVKHFNDVVEFGENQEFSDDIEYLLSGLKCNQPINTRCLSVISLATKCAMPSFRMHLRAHGMVAMVFKTLDDAQHHQNLALCTAALMYILSRDRLNMDLDRASLDLMIRLLEMEQDPHAKQLNEKDINKIKEKIRKLCETVHNKHLDLENITTGHLAMETLLSLTSKRAGDWFKEELRLLGGLDHIVDKVKECVNHLSSDENEEKLVASLWGAERCLRVLESVTVHNPENQSYLIAYKDSQLIVSSAKALQHCEEFIQRYNRAEDSFCSSDSKSLPHLSVTNHVGKAVEDCMRAIIGVLLNLTNDNEWGSTKAGEQDNLISTSLSCVLQVPRYLPQEQRFDIRVLGLGLLINLVEYSARNRHCLVNMETTRSYDSFCEDGEEAVRVVQLDAVHALVQLFLEREQAAQLAESQTDELIKEVPNTQHDKSGEWQETGGEIQWVSSEKCPNTEEPNKKEEDEEELDLNKALQHAGKHMEDCIVASYTALLLGCLCQESPINVTTVREHLPEGDFSIMTEMLKKFLGFMNLTCAVGTTGQKSISRVIEYLEHC